MKIAHLILAHKNPQQVLSLIEALTHPAFHFYIHIDKKVSIEPFKQLINNDKVSFIDDRSDIYWGNWGTIQATLNGFNTILPKGYDYINVISGQDFPIKSAEYIYQYFYERRGIEFITCDPVSGGDWGDVTSRVKNYHLVNWRVPGKTALGRLISKMLPPRVFPLDYELVGRANWFALTNESVAYAINFLKSHPEVIRYFKYCWGADEFIFSTILFNSPLKNKIRNNLTYVDWSETEIGHPKLLVAQDFKKLEDSEKLFARKFDVKVDPSILLMLKNLIGYSTLPELF